MSTALIGDTHQFVEDLKAGGFTAEQAESVSKALQRSDLSHLVTKADLKAELKDIELRLTNRMMTIASIQVAVIGLVFAFFK